MPPSPRMPSMMKRSLPLNSLSASFVAKIAPKVVAAPSSFNSAPRSMKNLLVSHNVAEPKRRARSALERHARYFDPDHDEAVTPTQTLHGMTALGLPWPL